jgi:hypothetical protein
MITPATSPEPTITTAPDVAAGDAAQRWAICCSGGGIRSASYCLGALQRLGQAGFLDKTKVLLGVSGGSYIAASLALVRHGLAKDGGQSNAEPAYAPGTPEEQHLRDNTRYLAPDAKTLLAGVLSLLLGIAVTLVLVLAPVFAVAHVWGWVLRSTGTLSYTAAHSSAQHWTSSVTAVTWWWISPVLATGVTLTIFLWFWASLVPDFRQREGRSQRLVTALGWVTVLTLTLAVGMLAVPDLIGWLFGPHSGALKTVLDGLGFGAGAAWTPAAVVGLATAVVAVSQSARKGLAKFSLLKARPASRGVIGTQRGLIAVIGAYLRVLLLPWLASALVVVVGFAVALRWVKDGAAAGIGAGQAGLAIGALAVILIARVLTDANRISLHDFYRWRLATAFAVERDATQKDDGPTSPGTKNIPGTRLSELRDDEPELVICATANINAEREIPAGRGGLSFTFDPHHATLRGPGHERLVQADTLDYEALVGQRRLTLFDVSAISGAAFSPLMGAATRQAYRILFTATDLRLGVWLPHPAVVKAARKELDKQNDPDAPEHRHDHWFQWLGLLLWYVLPHPRWQRGDERRGNKEARVWAYVLRLREAQAETEAGDGWRGFFGALLYRALQPTLGMLYAEAAGHTSYRATWVCVTDGGHYDNLGLVEALQRREHLPITHILVLDASGDRADSFSTLGGSIALARCDAAAEITLDPTEMIYPLGPGLSALDQGQVVRPWATGSVADRDGHPLCSIVVCKLGWWKAAPWDVRAYAAGHASYPTETTLDQLYDSAEFDAYRQLGWSAVDAAIIQRALPPGNQPQVASRVNGQEDRSRRPWLSH